MESGSALVKDTYQLETTCMGPSQGVGGTGGGGGGINFMRNMGTKNIRKQISNFREQGNMPIYFRGMREQVPTPTLRGPHVYGTE